MSISFPENLEFFLAKLEGVDQDGESIWHTVLVDSARRLVFDGLEKHALRLCNYIFDACVGYDFSFTRVEEVRVFNIQKVGKRPGRSRRMPKGKRKLRNMARPGITSSKGVRNTGSGDLVKIPIRVDVSLGQCIV